MGASADERRLGGLSLGRVRKDMPHRCGITWSAQWEIEQLPQPSVWRKCNSAIECFFLPPPPPHANICFIHVHANSTTLLGFINAPRRSPRWNVGLFEPVCSGFLICPLLVCTLGPRSHQRPRWINPWRTWWTSQATLGENTEMLFFVVLLCSGSFPGARAGLLCNHVWLGHLLAHTNDPNWESGLRFRVTDRLTGMWGMWPGGTRLLSGPPYQLASHCNGHLFSGCGGKPWPFEKSDRLTQQISPQLLFSLQALSCFFFCFFAISRFSEIFTQCVCLVFKQWNLVDPFC